MVAIATRGLSRTADRRSERNALFKLSRSLPHLGATVLNENSSGREASCSPRRYCVQKSWLDERAQSLSSPLALWPSRQLDELTCTTFSSPVFLIVLMFDAAVSCKAEFFSAHQSFLRFRFHCGWYCQRRCQSSVYES